MNFAALISSEPANNTDESDSVVGQIDKTIFAEPQVECSEIHKDQPSSSDVSCNQVPLPLREQLDTEETDDEEMVNITWTPEKYTSSDSDSEPLNHQTSDFTRENIASGSGHRWKSAKPQNWNYNTNVKKRNECLPYMSKQGKWCAAKSPQSINCTNCRFGCTKNRYEKDLREIIKYSYDYDDDYNQIRVSNSLRQSSQVYNLRQLYKKSLPISQQKKKDLLTLCKKNIIPPMYHSWYETLTTCNKVDTTAEPGEIDSENEEP